MSLEPGGGGGAASPCPPFPPRRSLRGPVGTLGDPRPCPRPGWAEGQRRDKGSPGDPRRLRALPSFSCSTRGAPHAPSPMQPRGKQRRVLALLCSTEHRGGCRPVPPICKPAWNSNAAVEGGGRGEGCTTSSLKCLALCLCKELFLPVAARMRICFRSF